ncbi:MAG: ABC transporter permease [Desulfarculaceae bacterium]|jgi:ABC-type polysaccharide/polyol phosphate export permease
MELIQHLSDLSRHRALISALVGRDLKGRYRGSILGFLWTFFNPLLLLLVYALVFSVYFRIQMDNYAVFMFTGLLPWIFFSQGLMEGTTSVTDGGSLVTKVLFPQQVLPTVKVVSNFINFLLSLPILIIFMLASGVPLKVQALAFPLVGAVHLLFTFSLALLFSAINVFMRDTQHILGNLLTLWFFLTPILYPLTQVPEKFRFLVYINPTALFSMAYHDLFFWGRWPRWDLLGLLFLLSLLILAVAIKVFEHYKEYFAEKI